VTAEVGTFDAEEGGYHQEHVPSSSFHTLPLQDMERVMMGLESRQSIATHAPPIADIRVANPVLTSNGGISRGLPSEYVREYAQPLDPDHGAKPLVPISLRSHNERPITSPIGPGDTKIISHPTRAEEIARSGSGVVRGIARSGGIFPTLCMRVSVWARVCVCVRGHVCPMHRPSGRDFLQLSLCKRVCLFACVCVCVRAYMYLREREGTCPNVRMHAGVERPTFYARRVSGCVHVCMCVCVRARAWDVC
jgi:hypothetical protein